MIPDYRLAREDFPTLDEVQSALESMMKCLPKTNDYPIWSSGDEIFCEDEMTAEHIADLIDMMYGESVVNTGYYDPEEDERNNEVRDTTGFYYVTVN